MTGPKNGANDSADNPLVLLHGFAGTPATWDEVLAALKERGSLPRKVLTLALAGHGSPPPTPGPGSFQAEVDRLAAEIQGAGLAGRACHLAGYSMGGRLALGLLLRYPKLFSGATLVGAHWGIEDLEEREARRRWDEAWASRLETDGLDAFLDAWEAQDLFSTQSDEQRATLRRQRQVLSPKQLASALRSLGTGAMPCYRAALAGLQVPTTWVAGALDSKFVALATLAAEACPKGSQTTAPGSGHNVVLESPDTVAEILTHDRLFTHSNPEPRKKQR